MQHITKTYPSSGIVANRDVNFEIQAGEIHALIGENGSGKSTLMHIMSGNLSPDGGTIEVDGTPVLFRSPADAFARGIGMVHQKVPVVPELTVFENITLGAHAAIPFPRRMIRERKQIKQLCQHLGVEVHVNRRVATLTASESVKVAILSLLYRNVRVMVLDEPSATFTPDEVRALFSIITSLAQEGHAIVLVTHKLREVFSIADRVSVMRHGRLVFTGATESTSKNELSTLMVGQEPYQDDATGAEPRVERPAATARSPGREMVLGFRSASVTRRDHTILDQVNLTIHRSEVFATTGIRESGLEDFERLCAGEIKLTSGSIEYMGRRVTGLSPRFLKTNEIGYVPTNRSDAAANAELTIADNAAILRRREFTHRGFFSAHNTTEFTREVLEDFGVKADSSEPFGRLSGGNAQKIILGREMNWARDLIMISEPFWGLDDRSRRMLIDKIQRMSILGTAILLFCADIDDVLEIADTVAVFYRGKVVEISPKYALTRQKLGRLMLGLGG